MDGECFNRFNPEPHTALNAVSDTAAQTASTAPNDCTVTFDEGLRRQDVRSGMRNADHNSGVLVPIRRSGYGAPVILIVAGPQSAKTSPVERSSDGLLCAEVGRIAR